MGACCALEGSSSPSSTEAAGLDTPQQQHQHSHCRRCSPNPLLSPMTSIMPSPSASGRRCPHHHQHHLDSRFGAHPEERDEEQGECQDEEEEEEAAPSDGPLSLRTTSERLVSDLQQLNTTASATASSSLALHHPPHHNNVVVVLDSSREDEAVGDEERKRSGGRRQLRHHYHDEETPPKRNGPASVMITAMRPSSLSVGSASLPPRTEVPHAPPSAASPPLKTTVVTATAPPASGGVGMTASFSSVRTTAVPFSSSSSPSATLPHRASRDELLLRRQQQPPLPVHNNNNSNNCSSSGGSNSPQSGVVMLRVSARGTGQHSAHNNNNTPCTVVMLPKPTCSPSSSTTASSSSSATTTTTIAARIPPPPSPQQPTSVLEQSPSAALGPLPLPSSSSAGGFALPATLLANWSVSTEHHGAAGEAGGGDSTSHCLCFSRRDSVEGSSGSHQQNPLHSPAHHRPSAASWIAVGMDQDFALPEWSTGPLTTDDESQLHHHHQHQHQQQHARASHQHQQHNLQQQSGGADGVEGGGPPLLAEPLVAPSPLRRGRPTPAPSIAASLPRTHVVSFSQSVNVHYDFPSGSDVMETLTTVRRNSSSGGGGGGGGGALDSMSLEGVDEAVAMTAAVGSDDDDEEHLHSHCFHGLPDESDTGGVGCAEATDVTSVSAAAMFVPPTSYAVMSELGSSTVSNNNRMGGQVVTVSLLNYSTHRDQLARPKI